MLIGTMRKGVLVVALFLLPARQLTALRAGSYNVTSLLVSYPGGERAP